MDLARRAHQSPGRLVDEDGLRGLPLAQRTGQGQSGVVVFLVWELVRLQEPLHRRRREYIHRGRLASCPSSSSLICSSLFADKTVRADGVTHRSVHSDSTYACVHTYRIYIRRAGSRAAVCGIRPLIRARAA